MFQENYISFVCSVTVDKNTKRKIFFLCCSDFALWIVNILEEQNFNWRFSMKRIITIALALIMVISMNAITVIATANTGKTDLEESGGRWVNASLIVLDLSYSGDKVTCTGRIKGYSDVNSITATFTLKRVNDNGTLTTVKTWPNLTSSSNSLNFLDTYSPVSKGQTYRLEVSATLVTTGGVSETVSDSIQKKYS